MLKEINSLSNPILKGTNTQHSGHRGQNFQTEFMAEIYSKSLARAIGKVLPMIFS